MKYLSAVDWIRNSGMSCCMSGKRCRLICTGVEGPQDIVVLKMQVVKEHIWYQPSDTRHNKEQNLKNKLKNFQPKKWDMKGLSLFKCLLLHMYSLI